MTTLGKGGRHKWQWAPASPKLQESQSTSAGRQKEGNASQGEAGSSSFPRAKGTAKPKHRRQLPRGRSTLCTGCSLQSAAGRSLHRASPKTTS